MKRLLPYVMPLAFCLLTGWLAWIGSHYWGWPCFLAYLTIPNGEERHQTREEDEKPSQEDINLLNEISQKFKKRDDGTGRS